MNRSQSWKKFPSNDSADFKDERRVASHPNLAPESAHNFSLGQLGAESRSTRSSVDDLRRKIVHLNKELDQERVYVKQLRREKTIELRHAREEEQRKTSTMLTELRTKLHKEKVNELTALREQMHKEKEKEIIQIIKQKDELLKSANHNWSKEMEESRIRTRSEVWNEAREESKKDFERERARFEQEIIDLRRQSKETVDALKIVQESDKRKADEIRRLFHEHEIQMEKFKRNSWQESRRQMAEIRQLLNIIEQLERKLGLESGHITKLRMEKEGLYDDIRRKTNTFDAWDNMMSSSMKNNSDGGFVFPPTSSTDPNNQELRSLQRKNIELSSLVKKLDEKNQQLATRNAEVLSELEKSEKEGKDNNRRLDRRNQDLVQNNKKLETKNKALHEDLNRLKKKSSATGKDVTGRKEKIVRSRGQQAVPDKEELNNLKQQIKEQAKTIEELKQNLMDKERRIDLLKERQKNNKKLSKLIPGRTALSVDSAIQPDDDAGSVYSDMSDLSEMSVSGSGFTSDAKRIKKLSKELLALERAYALLQAQVGGTMDVERDEMERQQLQSDMIESQARVHELERMMDDSTQAGAGELTLLQNDNKALYQKLVTAEHERDEALDELSQHRENITELQDEKDLLEFELEEISQLSCAGSEDEFSPKKSKNSKDVEMPLSLEEIKACLEELEKEKRNVLSVKELEALTQARTNLGMMSQRINHLEATEAVLRSRVKDFEERSALGSPGLVYRQYAHDICEQETMTDSQIMGSTDTQLLKSPEHPKDFEKAQDKDAIVTYQTTADLRELKVELVEKECGTELTWMDVSDMERMYTDFIEGSREAASSIPQVMLSAAESYLEKAEIEKSEKDSMTDLVWADIVEVEANYKDFLENIDEIEEKLAKVDVERDDKETMTDFTWEEIVDLENSYKTQLEWLQEKAEGEGTRAEFEKHEKEIMTDMVWEDIVEVEESYRGFLQNIEQIEEKLAKLNIEKADVKIMTDLAWEDVIDLQNSYIQQIETLQEMVQVQGESEVEKNDKLVMTDMSWMEVSEVQETYSEFLDNIHEIEEKVSKVDVERSEIGVMTDCVWDEILEREKYYKSQLEVLQGMQMAESIQLEEKEASQKEKLPAEKEEKGVMTDMIWTEVVEVEENYKEFLENVVEIEDKFARVDVEKTDSETMTELTEIEKVNKESLTDITWEDIDQLEKHYIEMAGLEKFDKETLTEFTLETIEHLERLYRKTSELVRVGQACSTECTGNDSELIERNYMEAIGDAEKRDRETSTIFTMEDIELLEKRCEEQYEELEEVNASLERKEQESVEKDEKVCMTDLTWDEIVTLENMFREQNEKSEAIENNVEADLKGNNAVQMVDVKVMTDLAWEDDSREELYREEIERLQFALEGLKNREHEMEDVMRDCGREEIETDEKEVMTDFAWKEIEYLEKTYREWVEELQQMKDELQQKGQMSERTDQEDSVCMTDLVWEDIVHLESSYKEEINKLQAIVDSQENVGGVEKREQGIMTDLAWEDIVHQERSYKEEINKLQAIVDSQENEGSVEKAEQGIMTDLVWEEFIHLENSYREQFEEMQIMIEKIHETNKEEKGTMTDVAWSEMMYLEDSYSEQLEELQIMIGNTTENQNEKTEVRRQTEEQEVMTDMSWEEIIHLETTYTQQLEELQVMAENIKETENEKVDIDKVNQGVMTELAWEEIVYLENAYREQLEELEVISENIKDSEKDTDEKEVMTDLTWDEFQFQEDSYKQQIEELKETIAEMESEKEDIEVLQQAWKGELGEIAVVEDTTDALDRNNSDTMALLAWRVNMAVIEDVVHLEDQRRVESQLLQRVENTTEKGCMTELTWEDVVNVESACRLELERLQDMEDNMLSEAEKEDKDCMTDVIWQDVEHQLKQLNLTADNKIQRDSEQNDKECMTDLAWREPIASLENTDRLEHEQLEENTKYKRQEEGTDYMTEPLENAVPNRVVDTSMEEELNVADHADVSRSFDNEKSLETDNRQTSTEITLADLLYLEKLEVEHHELLLEKKQRQAASQLFGISDKLHQEVETERTLTDLQYLQEIEAEHQLLLLEKNQRQTASQLFGVTDKVDQEVETELTLTDLQSLQEMEAEHQLLLLEKNQWQTASQLFGVTDKVDQEVETELTLTDLQYLQEMEAERQLLLLEKNQRQTASQLFGVTDKVDQEVETELTLTDLQYLQEMEAEHQLLLLKKQRQTASQLFGVTDKVDQVVETELTLTDLQYLQEIEAEHRLLLLEKNQRQTASQLFGVTDKVDQEVETELTLTDLQYLQEMEAEHQLLLLEKNQRQTASQLFAVTDILHQEVETELTLTDLQYLQEIETEYQLLLVEKEFWQEGLHRSDPSSKVEQEVETDLKAADLEYLEEIDEIHQQCILDNEQQVVEKVDQEVGTDLNMFHLQYLEEVESVHQTCDIKDEDFTDSLSDEHNNLETDSKITLTDLTLLDLHYLEEVEAVHQVCLTKQEIDDSEKTDTSEKESIGVGTELTSSVLEYLEEVAIAHKEIVREYEAFRQSVLKKKENVSVMTDMTSEHLDYLGEMALRGRQVGDLISEMDGEDGELRNREQEQENGKVLGNDCQVMTDVTAADLINLEEEVRSLRKAKEQDEETSWVVIERKMLSKGINTDLEGSDLNYLEEIEELYNESMENNRAVTEKEDVNVMTELTIDDLEYLEEAECVYRNLNETGILARLEEPAKPTEDRGMLTDLVTADIEYLEDVEFLYREKESNNDKLDRIEGVDKAVETDINAFDLDRIENLANNAESTRDVIQKKGIREHVTEQIYQGIVSSVESEPQDYGMKESVGHLGRNGNPDVTDIGVQCELKDILSLAHELQLSEGGDIPCYVSALRISRQHKAEFDPVEVTLRHHDSDSSHADPRDVEKSPNRPSLEKRHSSNVSLNLDYGWRSSSSLDVSATPISTGMNRQDSPVVPLAQDEVFDLTDVESLASEEADVLPVMHDDKDSAVAKFDRFMTARKDSELNTLTALSGGVDHPDGHPNKSKSVEELLKENDRLRERIRELENMKGDLSAEEMEILRRKVEQLKEAERQMEMLHVSNVALRDRIENMHEDVSGDTTERSTRDNWSEIDPSEQPGRARLLLVHDLGLGLTESDVESLMSTRTSSPVDSARRSDSFSRLMAEYIKSEQGTQAGPGPAVNQEIQTTGDLLKLIELSYDGTIPDHIAKELEKLKAENRALYEELMELRRMKLAASTPRSSDRPSDEAVRSSRHPTGQPRDTSSPAPSVEGPVQSSRRPVVESGIDWVTQLGEVDEGEGYGAGDDSPRQPVRDVEECAFSELSRPKQKLSSRGMIHEPEITSARSTRDSEADVEGQLKELDHAGDQDDTSVDSRQRTNTDGILGFEYGEGGSPPPLPSSAPPPVPIEPPPDIPGDNSHNMDFDMQTIDMSPLRDSRTLRAASHQRSQPYSKPSPLEREIDELLSDNVESEVMPLEEDLIMVEGEPDLVGASSAVPIGSRALRPAQKNRPGFYPAQRATSLRTDANRVPETHKRAPPPTLPKPKMPGVGGRRCQTPMRYSGAMMTSLTQARDSLDEEDEMMLPVRGSVRAKASAINQGELDAMNEKIGFLERQLKNKENVLRSMKSEASDLESQALLERKGREIKILEEDIAFLKQENQKKERELLGKIGEINRKSYEVEQWKAEANNAERQRKRIEASYMNLQTQARNLYGADTRLNDVQAKHSTLEKENSQLADKVKKLEKTEKEFKQLEYNISVLQNQLQDMESVEQERDDVLNKLKVVEDQRDDLLRKGRMVESERNDFLRNNKIMEMQRDELEQRYAMGHKNLMDLKATLGDLEQSMKESQNKMLDAQHERNYAQTQYNKLEANSNEMQQRLAAVTQERNSLENKVAELQDLNREHVKLEEGFHTLRLKVAELTRQKDDVEMQIPTLKAKVCLLKKACKEKDDFIDKLNDEIRELRHSIATSTLDDLSKIKSYGYSPENFVKFSGTRDSDIYGNRGIEDLVESKLRSEGSPKIKAKSSSAKRYVALFDYDPHRSSVSGHPELELKLKEGDHLVVYGDMDMNGYLEAELDGVGGLVSSMYVEELEDNQSRGVAPRDTRKDKMRGDLGRDAKPTAADTVSSGHSSMSPGSSYAGSDSHRQCFVALYDYNPYQSCTMGRPEVELPLKKGDIMTVTGDVDPNGYYRAEMDGQIGLVPSNLVEEVSSSSYLQPTSSKAPEQILSMLDNIRIPTRTTGASYPLPAPVSPSAAQVFPTHLSPGSIIPVSQVSKPVMAAVTRDAPIRPIFTPHMTAAEAQQLSAPVLNGVVHEASPPLTSQPTMTSPPQITALVQRPVVQTASRPKARPSKAVVPRSTSVRKLGPPSPPGSFQVLRPVNHDAILVGWKLPEMDEFGRSNNVVVKGYKIYTNGDFKMDVRSQLMAKALVDDVDLRYPIQLSIRTIGEDRSSSSEVSTTFTDTITSSRMSVTQAIEDSSDLCKWRTFVGLYDYDPLKSSPNSNPQYELDFCEGDILRVEDTSRKDGFYFGSLNGKKGLIPSNFVEEVAVAHARGPMTYKRQNSRPLSAPSQTPTRPISSASRRTTTPTPPNTPTTPGQRKKMVALYEYSPEDQSPLDNPDAELSFKKGQVITVLGSMNWDGFYLAEIAGRQGLVPASFMESSPELGRRLFDKKSRS